MYKHILIPTDGSAASTRAAKAAIDLAHAVGARVTAFFAAPPATPLVYEGLFPVRYLPPDEHAAMIERAAQKYLGAIGEQAKAAGVPCETVHVTNEYPADAIVDVAKRRKCDLIVMASHGRHGLSAALLGSETQKVLANAKIPVLVFR